MNQNIVLNSRVFERIISIFPERVKLACHAHGKSVFKWYVAYDLIYRVVWVSAIALLTHNPILSIAALYAPGCTSTGVPAAVGIVGLKKRLLKD